MKILSIVSFFLCKNIASVLSFSCVCKTTQTSNITSVSVCDCPTYPSTLPTRKPSTKPSIKPSIKPTSPPLTSHPLTSPPLTSLPILTTTKPPVETPSKTIPYDICSDGVTRCSGSQYCPDGSLCSSSNLISYDPILEVVNYCSFPIWIHITGNAIKNNPVLPKITKIEPNNSQAYDAKGWSGRVNTNHSRYPPLAEFYFGRTIWYDISLVDGFDSLPISIKTSTPTCKDVNCSLSLTDCPAGQLKDGSCMSLCTSTHLPEYCCQNLTPTACQKSPIVNTSYVKQVNQKCPYVYAHAYDDKRGLHTCPGDTNIILTFC